MPKADLGFNTFLTFGTTAYTGTSAGLPGSELIELKTLSLSVFQYESVDSTALNTVTARTYIQSDIYDPGTMSATFNWDPSKVPPTGTEVFTITFPDGEDLICSGSVEGWSVDISEGVMEATLDVKFSGPITGSLMS